MYFICAYASIAADRPSPPTSHEAGDAVACCRARCRCTFPGRGVRGKRARGEVGESCTLTEGRIRYPTTIESPKILSCSSLFSMEGMLLRCSVFVARKHGSMEASIKVKAWEERMQRKDDNRMFSGASICVLQITRGEVSCLCSMLPL
jgi:hypothetical protein